jgi:HEAT repeat protein
MEGRFCSKLIAGLLFTVAALTPIVAQVPKEQAWTILQDGAKQQDVRQRAIAIRALGLIPNDAGVEKLANDALADQNYEVRISVATALGQMKAKKSIPALKEMLKDKEVGVILAAAASLRQMGDPSAYFVYYAVLTGESKTGKELMTEQKKMLNDPKKMAQFGFEQGIGFIPFAGIGYGALKAFTKDDKSPVRAAAAAALATDPDPKSAKALVTAASDKSWIVRAAALDAIARRDDPTLVGDIVAGLSDEKPEVKYTAAAAVYRLSNRQSK